MQTKKIDKLGKLAVETSTIFEGDALTVLQRMVDRSVQVVITSPPLLGS